MEDVQGMSGVQNIRPACVPVWVLKPPIPRSWKSPNIRSWSYGVEDPGPKQSSFPGTHDMLRQPTSYSPTPRTGM